MSDGFKVARLDDGHIVDVDWSTELDFSDTEYDDEFPFSSRTMLDGMLEIAAEATLLPTAIGELLGIIPDAEQRVADAGRRVAVVIERKIRAPRHLRVTQYKRERKGDRGKRRKKARWVTFTVMMPNATVEFVQPGEVDK